MPEFFRALNTYVDRFTGRGFRHTMSSILYEQEVNSAWIALPLAQVDKNSMWRTYNHAQYLEGRGEMMQWYGEYIDKSMRYIFMIAG